MRIYEFARNKFLKGTFSYFGESILVLPPTYNAKIDLVLRISSGRMPYKSLKFKKNRTIGSCSLIQACLPKIRLALSTIILSVEKIRILGTRDAGTTGENIQAFSFGWTD